MENETHFIRNDEFIEILEGYISIQMRKDIRIKKALGIIYEHGMPIINLKLYFDNYIMGEKFSVYLNHDDIINLINQYGNFDEVVDFEYIGHVRRSSKSFESYSPIFEGVNLCFKKVKKLTK